MNIYYDPEKFGLVIVDVIELTDEQYQFDTLVIWRELETEKLYWARDSGCSCPTPFENYHGIEDLTPFNIDSVRAEILGEMSRGYVSAEKVAQFLDNLQLRGIR